MILRIGSYSVALVFSALLLSVPSVNAQPIWPIIASGLGLRSDRQILTLPETAPQDDSWSCGANSAARVLRFYGHQVSYEGVRQATSKKLIFPERIRNPIDGRWVNIRTGTPPVILKQVLERWEKGNVRLQKQTSLPQLLAILNQGKPAIALVRVGTFRIALLGDLPYLHWIVITGYDAPSQTLFYTDTNSQTYTISYATFQQQWALGPAEPKLKASLRSLGVEAQTMIWVDRFAPRL